MRKTTCFFLLALVVLSGCGAVQPHGSAGPIDLLENASIFVAPGEKVVIRASNGDFTVSNVDGAVSPQEGCTHTVTSIEDVMYDTVECGGVIVGGANYPHTRTYVFYLWFPGTWYPAQ